MIKATRPKSLFGKLPYYKEQITMIPVADFVTRGAMIIDPYTVGMYVPFVGKLSDKRRRKIVKKSFAKARELLGKIGV